MGSKAPIAKSSCVRQDADQNVSNPFHRLGSSKSAQLLERMAAALEIPTSAFMELPNAVSDNTRPASHAPFEKAVHRDCLEMVRTFSRVSDPEERRRLLTLVSEAADRS